MSVTQRILSSRFAVPILTGVLYTFATLNFIRYYVVSTQFYLDMPRYLAGRERLPFQERVLPILLMWPVNHSAALMRIFAERAETHAHSLVPTIPAATPRTGAFYILALLSFAVAGYFTTRLYRAVTETGLLAPLVFPFFLVVTLWTYVVHIDANFSYPYDLPSLAFFTAGLFCIYTRRFLPLPFIVFFGTMNRETTLFLIGIYILDAASTGITDTYTRVRDRFSFARVPWLRVALLCALWLAVKVTLHYIFRHNDNSENYVRLRENFGRLKPRLWPTLFNICGYLLPIVLLLYRQIRPVRYANYIFIFPLWCAVMFYTGVILETRIYGELSSYVTIAAVLLLERSLADRLGTPKLRSDQAERTAHTPAARDVAHFHTVKERTVPLPPLPSVPLHR